MKRWQLLVMAVLAGLLSLAMVPSTDATVKKDSDPKVLAEKFGLIVGPGRDQ
jgi:hypothetical protein